MCPQPGGVGCSPRDRPTDRLPVTAHSTCTPTVLVSTPRTSISHHPDPPVGTAEWQFAQGTAAQRRHDRGRHSVRSALPGPTCPGSGCRRRWSCRSCPDLSHLRAVPRPNRTCRRVQRSPKPAGTDRTSAPANTAAALDDLTQPGPELLAVACRIADEVSQASASQRWGTSLQPAKLRQRYWGRDFHPLLVAWARENGISIY
jgi:hypothetical protein